MGVVRDVTIDQLTQAVTGISTSGMSDSTGQAIVTSINNLRSATSPIITDDTGQAINTTLQSLVQAIKSPIYLQHRVTLACSQGSGACQITFPTGFSIDTHWLIVQPLFTSASIPVWIGSIREISSNYWIMARTASGGTPADNTALYADLIWIKK